MEKKLFWRSCVMYMSTGSSCLQVRNLNAIVNARVAAMVDVDGPTHL